MTSAFIMWAICGLKLSLQKEWVEWPKAKKKDLLAPQVVLFRTVGYQGERIEVRGSLYHFPSSIMAHFFWITPREVGLSFYGVSLATLSSQR